MALAKAPSDMGYRELGAFIKAMEASGSDMNELRVERMLAAAGSEGDAPSSCSRVGQTASLRASKIDTLAEAL